MTNKLTFRGVLATVDEPSDVALNGSMGKRVILTKAAVEAALPSLIGLKVNFNYNECGVLTHAEILESRMIVVQGYLYDVHPALLVIRPGYFGLSYEITDAVAEDMRARFLKVTKAIFTGIEIVPLRCAGYLKSTFIIDFSVRHKEEH